MMKGLEITAAKEYLPTDQIIKQIEDKKVQIKKELAELRKLLSKRYNEKDGVPGSGISNHVSLIWFLELPGTLYKK